MNGAPVRAIPDIKDSRYLHPVPSRLKRYQTEGHDHFITFSCYRRLPFLDNSHARSLFETTPEQLRQRHHFHVFGYVLMPEHVHLLLSEPRHTKLEDILRALKAQSSRKLKGDRQQFWQTRYYDFNIFTHPKFVENLRCLHRNPVHRGLVKQPEAWPWSSYRHWLTGEIGRVEIESHWTWNRRETADLLPHSTPLIAIMPR